jgi:hypothetical protein
MTAASRKHRTTTRLAARGCLLALCLLTVPAAAQASSIGFSPQSSSPLSVPASSLGSGAGGTESIAVGNLTDNTGASGVQSLVVAEPNANKVQIFPGTGTGTYGAAITLTITDPVAVAIGDVNGDGLNDIVVVSNSNSTVSVLLNGGGTSTFTTSAGNSFGSWVLPSTPGPDAVALGDVNGDGRLDIFTADSGVAGLSVLQNVGTATSTPASSTFSTSSYTFLASPGGSDVPTSVAVGNLGGHAKDLDAVTADSSGDNITEYLNNGSGTLANGTDTGVAGDPVSVAIGNLHGGSTNDVVSADNGTSALSVLKNNGTGTLTLQGTTYGTGAFPSSIALGDFNGDGKLDAVTANSESGSASVLLGNGDDTFQTAQTIYNGIGAQPAGIAVGNLVSGNTAPDIVVTNSHPAFFGAGDFVSVILNTSLPTLAPAATSLTYPSTLNGAASAGQTLTITNNGPAVLKISKIAASSNFSVTPSSATVSSGASTNVTVTFTPKGSSGYGALSGTLTFTSNASSNPSVALSGFGNTLPAVISTQPASGVNGFYAELNGNALSQGPATFYFQYGPTSAYDNQTQPVTLSSATAQQTPAATIPVEPGQLYHYQLVVSNVAGTVYGGDTTFATPPDAPAFNEPAGGTVRLKSVLAHGLRYRVRDSSSATVAVRVLVSVALARADHIPVSPAKGATHVSIARTTVQLNGTAPKTFTVKFAGAIARALAKVGSLPVALQGFATANGVTGSPGSKNVVLG